MPGKRFLIIILTRRIGSYRHVHVIMINHVSVSCTILVDRLEGFTRKEDVIELSTYAFDNHDPLYDSNDLVLIWFKIQIISRLLVLGSRRNLISCTED